MSARQRSAALVLALAAFFVAATTSMAQKSATMDEPLYLAAGYSYFVTRDFRYNLEHPPLIKLLVALPLFALHLDPPGPWERPAGVPPAETKFVFGNTRPAGTIVFWGRLPIVVLGTAVAAFLYWWTKQLAGTAAGFIALVLYSVDPTLLAHTQLATLDMGLAGCVALAIYAVIRYLKRPTPGTLWGAGGAFALAMLVKFTAIVLVPIYALLCVMRYVRRGARGASLAWASAWTSLWRLAVVVAAATLGLAFVAYAFQIRQSEPDWDLVRFLQAHAGPSSIPIRALLKVSHVPRPAPDFWAGVSFQLKHGASEETPAYLNGQRYRGGRLDYLPVAFLVKTPVATLALGGLALAVFTYRFVARTKAPPSFDEIGILAAMILFFGVNVLVRVNLGIRYLLPLYPLLFIFIGLQFAWLHAAAAGRKLVVSLIIVGMLTYGIVSSVRAYPHYLAYFNEPSGGPANGWRHLADSNLDWGQDLPGVQAYLATHRVETVYLRYYGTAVPDAYGIHWNALPTNEEVATKGAPPGIVAVSISALLIELPWDSWVWQYHPTAAIGHSIWIFDLRPRRGGG